jgi:hypothetical protein
MRRNRLALFVLSFVMVFGVISISSGTVLAISDPATGLEYTVAAGLATITDFTPTAG